MTSLTKCFLLLATIGVSGCVTAEQAGSPQKPIAVETDKADLSSNTAKPISPFLTPGTCRKVYLVTDSQQAGISELKRLEKAFGKLGGRFGIYKRADGSLLAADTMDRYYENPKQFVKQRLDRNVTIDRLKYSIRQDIKDAQNPSKRERGQYLQPSAYCSTGEEIVADTGVRYYNPTSTGGGGLIGSAIAFSLATLEEASKVAGTVSYEQPVDEAASVEAVASTSSSATPTPSLSIQNDGSSASGKPAYSIGCPSGRNFRIWRSDGQWWDARGAQGGNSRSLDDQANFLCG